MLGHSYRGESALSYLYPKCSKCAMADAENLFQIFSIELFGSLAEEKEIKGIVSKVMEARHSKSSDSYEFLARFCSQERVTQLIIPLKEVSSQ